MRGRAGCCRRSSGRENEDSRRELHCLAQGLGGGALPGRCAQGVQRGPARPPCRVAGLHTHQRPHNLLVDGDPHGLQAAQALQRLQGRLGLITSALLFLGRTRPGGDGLHAHLENCNIRQACRALIALCNRHPHQGNGHACGRPSHPPQQPTTPVPRTRTSRPGRARRTTRLHAPLRMSAATVPARSASELGDVAVSCEGPTEGHPSVLAPRLV